MMYAIAVLVGSFIALGIARLLARMFPSDRRRKYAMKSAQDLQYEYFSQPVDAIQTWNHAKGTELALKNLFNDFGCSDLVLRVEFNALGECTRLRIFVDRLRWSSLSEAQVGGIVATCKAHWSTGLARLFVVDQGANLVYSCVCSTTERYQTESSPFEMHAVTPNSANTVQVR